MVYSYITSTVGSMMTKKERVFHAILFELLAILSFVPIAIYLTDQHPGQMVFLSFTLSIIAMIWNYLYNILCDKLLGPERLERSFNIRILHGMGFEFGMMIMSFPVIMFVLDMDLWSVFLLDIGAVVFFFFYAIVFNWMYDIVRNWIVKSEPEA